MQHSIRRRLLAPLAAAALALPCVLSAQAPPAAPAPAPADTGLKVIVLTIGPGDAVWEKFGHNAVWVHDPAAGTDLAYNYGMFDFAAPDFFSNFAKGRLEYWMDGFDAHAVLEHYRRQNRTIWSQELALTPQQAASVRDFLAWNARPENRFYLYDYFRDNCSTRVRDVVDQAVGGALKAATGGEASNTTFRWHTARLVGEGAGSAGMYTAILGGLGPAADRPISRWEEMFIPMKLRDRLRELKVGGEPLVRREQVVYEASGRPEEPARPPFWIPGFLAAGLALGGALAWLASRARRSVGARAGFAILAGGWTLFAGVGGLVLLGLWLFTDHSIAYANENLFQLSPLAPALVVLLPALAFGGRWAARAAVVLTTVIAGLSMLGFVLQVLPWLDQGNGFLIALAMPVNLALAWAARRLAGSLPARVEGGTAAAPKAKRARAAAA